MNLKTFSSLLIASGALLAQYGMASSSPVVTQARMQVIMTGGIGAPAQQKPQATLIPSTDTAAAIRRVLSGQIDFAAPHAVAAETPHAVATPTPAAQVQRVLLGQAG